MIREELLLGYGYNTARAYWGDLEDLFWWAENRGKDLLNLSEKDFKQYCALLRRRGYSESTIRRRGTSFNLLASTRSTQFPSSECIGSTSDRTPR